MTTPYISTYGSHTYIADLRAAYDTWAKDMEDTYQRRKEEAESYGIRPPDRHILEFERWVANRVSGSWQWPWQDGWWEFDLAERVSCP